MSATSLTNTLARKNNSTRYKATREEESEQEVCGPKKSPEHIPTSTVENFAGKYFVPAHFKSPLTRKTTSLLNGQPETELLVYPIQEPKFQTIDSTESVVYKGPTSFWSRMAHEEGTGHTDGYDEKEEELVTFEFPIREAGGATQMKNSPPSALPNFHGFPSEDLDAFLFEFYVLCRSYSYSSNAHKLKLFPATMKDAALKWFMGLASNSFTTWDEMKKVFLKKYQDYCKTRDLREEICGMTQKEGESLEDLVERFQYNLQRSKMNQLSNDTKEQFFLGKSNQNLLRF